MTYLCNFELRATVLEEDENGKKTGRQKRVVLAFDRRPDVPKKGEGHVVDLDTSPIEVIQSQGTFTCVDTTPHIEFQNKTQEHTLLSNVIGFMEHWCEEAYPFVTDEEEVEDETDEG